MKTFLSRIRAGAKDGLLKLIVHGSKTKEVQGEQPGAREDPHVPLKEQKELRSGLRRVDHGDRKEQVSRQRENLPREGRDPRKNQLRCMPSNLLRENINKPHRKLLPGTKLLKEFHRCPRVP